MKRILCALAALLSVHACASTNDAFRVSETFLAAMRSVESSDGRFLVGKSGERGPYQISEIYLRDTGLQYTLDDMDDEAKAREVVFAYWNKWVPAEGEITYEMLARIHNGGGPLYRKDPTNSATGAYWSRIKSKMEEIENEKAGTEGN
jgi:hypothetical protein